MTTLLFFAGLAVGCVGGSLATRRAEAAPDLTELARALHRYETDHYRTEADTANNLSAVLVEAKRAVLRAAHHHKDPQ